jgi:hypothetical protein
MISRKLIGLARMTLTDTQNKITADGRLSESFGEKLESNRGPAIHNTSARNNVPPKTTSNYLCGTDNKVKKGNRKDI